MSDPEPSNRPRRSVIELLILILGGIVVFILFSSTIYVVVAELRDPTVDTSPVTESISSSVTTILGALLGLIAGRSDKD